MIPNIAIFGSIGSGKSQLCKYLTGSKQFVPSRYLLRSTNTAVHGTGIFQKGDEKKSYRIIDTPGFYTHNYQNSAYCYDQSDPFYKDAPKIIEQANAVILLLSVCDGDPHITDAYSHFISYLQKSKKPFYVTLSYIDALGGEYLLEAEAKITSKLGVDMVYSLIAETGFGMSELMSSIFNQFSKDVAYQEIAAQAPVSAPKIAVFGLPGSGKSQLCRYLTGSSQFVPSGGGARTDDKATYGFFRAKGEEKFYALIDTPGFYWRNYQSSAYCYDQSDPFYKDAPKIIEQAHAIILLVHSTAVSDSQAINLYKHFITYLQKLKKPFYVAVSCVDLWSDEEIPRIQAEAVVSLNVDRVYTLNPKTGFGVAEFMEHIYTQLPKQKPVQNLEIKISKQEAEPLTTKKTTAIPLSMLKFLEIPRAELEFNENDILGKGSFGIVYKGTWQGNETVAIKQLRLAQPTPEALNEFKEEMETHAKLQHQRIIRIFGVCTKEAPYCMVLEFMANGSLHSVLHSTRALSLQEQKQIALDIAAGLAYLHSKKTFHRDLKSLNVLLDPLLRARLSDFGLAKIKSESNDPRNTGKIAGTLAWMAPEWLRAHPYTDKCDVYSYGITLWEVVFRKLPFADEKPENQALISEWVKSGKRPVISGCAPKFASLIKFCWAQNPSDRPTADRIAAQMQDFMKEGPFIPQEDEVNILSKGTRSLNIF